MGRPRLSAFVNRPARQGLQYTNGVCISAEVETSPENDVDPYQWLHSAFGVWAVVAMRGIGTNLKAAGV